MKAANNKLFTNQEKEQRKRRKGILINDGMLNIQDRSEFENRDMLLV